MALLWRSSSFFDYYSCTLLLMFWTPITKYIVDVVAVVASSYFMWSLFEFDIVLPFECVIVMCCDGIMLTLNCQQHSITFAFTSHSTLCTPFCKYLCLVVCFCLNVNFVEMSMHVCVYVPARVCYKQHPCNSI